MPNKHERAQRGFDLADDEDTRRVPAAALRALLRPPPLPTERRRRNGPLEVDDEPTEQMPRLRVTPRTPTGYLPKKGLELTWSTPEEPDDFEELRPPASEMRLLAPDRSDVGPESTDEWIALRLANCLGR
jgi:hypothetical protein